MGREGEAVKALLPEFEPGIPDCGVRVQQVPWSAAQEKLLTAFAGDALPMSFTPAPGSRGLAPLAPL
jgi:multiple sugar transport system substrate-binding protein